MPDSLAAPFANESLPDSIPWWVAAGRHIPGGLRGACGAPAGLAIRRLGVGLRRLGQEESMGFLEKWQAQLLSVLRFVSGLLFFEHGCSKLLHFPHVAMFDNIKVGSIIWIAGVIELVGGALVTVGFLTRYAAFVMSGEM